MGVHRVDVRLGAVLPQYAGAAGILLPRQRWELLYLPDELVLHRAGGASVRGLWRHSARTSSATGYPRWYDLHCNSNVRSKVTPL